MSIPAIRAMKISDVKSELSRLVNEVHRKETRVLVEKSGIPVAALVSADDLARLTRLEREWNERTAALEAFGAAFQDVPTDELEARIGQIVNDVQAPQPAKEKRRSA